MQLGMASTCQCHITVTVLRSPRGSLHLQGIGWQAFRLLDFEPETLSPLAPFPALRAIPGAFPGLPAG